VIVAALEPEGLVVGDRDAVELCVVERVPVLLGVTLGVAREEPDTVPDWLGLCVTVLDVV